MNITMTTTLPIVTEDGLVTETRSLSELLGHLRKQNGTNVWIKDTSVYIKSHLDAQEISGACVLSMLVLSEQHCIEEYVAIIDLDPDHQRDVAEVTARIFSMPDPIHDKVIFFSSNPHSASIISYISPKEIQQMLVSNATREHCFNRCTFTSEQSVALLDHDSPVNLNLNHCSMDSSAMADTLVRKERSGSLGKLTLASDSHNADSAMESFWAALNHYSSENNSELFDEITLQGYSFRSMDVFHIIGANVQCLGFAVDCRFEDSAFDLLARAVEMSLLKAKSLKIYSSLEESDEHHWSFGLLRAIGHENCCLEELHVGGHVDEEYVNVDSAVLDMLQGNSHLQHLHLSVTPLQFPRDTWNTLLDRLSRHQSLKEVTLRPPSESVPAGWKDELETALFQNNQDIVLKVKALHSSDRDDMARCWQDECDDARLGGTCRILDHHARSFVLTSALEQSSNNHGLVFSLLRRNQDLLACRARD